MIEVHPKTNTCPTLHEIYAICDDMYNFLTNNPTNLCVVVQSTVINLLHFLSITLILIETFCKQENSGTSALIVCAFLLYMNASDTAENVCTIFAVKKSTPILQPSENR